MGSGTAKFEGSCRASSTDRLCCGVENPHALLLQVATSLSFSLPVVMPFVGFSGILFGGSPDTKTVFRRLTVPIQITLNYYIRKVHLEDR